MKCGQPQPQGITLAEQQMQVLAAGYVSSPTLLNVSPPPPLPSTHAARTHACMHACTHARTHARTPARTQARAHARSNAATHAATHARKHPCTSANTCVLSCMSFRAYRGRSRVRAHTHIHKYTRTHIYTITRKRTRIHTAAADVPKAVHGQHPPQPQGSGSTDAYASAH